MRVITEAAQLFGGAGYAKDFGVERFMRDAKITQIYVGTNQIQRVVMARACGDDDGARLASVAMTPNGTMLVPRTGYQT